MDFWVAFQALILGVVEGLTEFLPISSTGHLLLAQHWLGARSDTYNIVIQAGAILAVTLIYWRRLVDLATGWRDPANRDYLAKLATAFLLTAVLGVVVKKAGFELPETVTPIAWALVIGGSMGGARTLEWTLLYPEAVDYALVLAVSARASAWQIGIQSAQITSITQDPDWRGGDYHGTGVAPDAGLAAARRIAHLTYRGEVELDERFGNDAQPGEDPGCGGR